jgi:hypothetical protein
LYCPNSGEKAEMLLDPGRGVFVMLGQFMKFREICYYIFPNIFDFVNHKIFDLKKHFDCLIKKPNYCVRRGITDAQEKHQQYRR